MALKAKCVLKGGDATRRGRKQNAPGTGAV